MPIAIYAGSFDPPTKAHIWIIKKALEIFEKLIVAIADNPDKNHLLTTEERLKIIASTFANQSPKPEVIQFQNQFISSLANTVGAKFLIRGIRDEKDFIYEMKMAQFNHDIHKSLNPHGELTTISFLSPSEMIKLSSSSVKSMIGFKDDLKAMSIYLPNATIETLKTKFNDHSHQ